MHVDNTVKTESNNKLKEDKIIQEATKSDEHQSTGDIDKISSNYNNKDFTNKNLSAEKSLNSNNQSVNKVKERSYCKLFRTYKVKPQRTLLEPFLFQKFVTKYN